MALVKKPCELPWKPRDYQDGARDMERQRRSLRVVVTHGHFRWHVSVTFHGSLHKDFIAQAKRPQRQQSLEDLCRCIDFDRLDFFANIVTKVFMRRDGDDTPSYYQNDPITLSSYLPLRKESTTSSEYHSALI